MIQVAAAVEALLRQGRDPVPWMWKSRIFLYGEIWEWHGSCEALMSMMFHVMIMVGWNLGGHQSLVESLIFVSSIKKAGSPYFWVSRSNFNALGSLCFTSFDHWMRFMVNGSYQWHQNEWFFSENTPRICFLHLLSFLFFSFYWQEIKQIYTHTPCFLFLFVAGHVKKNKSHTRKQFPILQLPKKRCLLFCVCHQTSLVLRFLRSFVRFVPSPRPWTTCTCSSPPIRRPPRARQNDGANWGWRCRGENVPW